MEKIRIILKKLGKNAISCEFKDLRVVRLLEYCAKKIPIIRGLANIVLYSL